MGTDSPVSEVVAHARFTGIRDAMDLVDDNEGIGSPCVRDATAAPRDGRLSLLTSLGRITSGVATQSADSGRFDCGSSVGRTRLPERSIEIVPLGQPHLSAPKCQHGARRAAPVAAGRGVAP